MQTSNRRKQSGPQTGRYMLQLHHGQSLSRLEWTDIMGMSLTFNTYHSSALKEHIPFFFFSRVNNSCMQREHVGVWVSNSWNVRLSLAKCMCTAWREQRDRAHPQGHRSSSPGLPGRKHSVSPSTVMGPPESSKRRPISQAAVPQTKCICLSNDTMAVSEKGFQSGSIISNKVHLSQQ